MSALHLLSIARRHALLIVAGLTVAALLAAGLLHGWHGLFLSGDQRGRILFARGDFAGAAQNFGDPVWRGVALFRAGDFKPAAELLAGLSGPVAAFDAGNASVMLGQYANAVAAYDRALAARPDWPEAQANRALAQARADRMKAPGEDAGDQREGADEIVYDKDAASKDGQDTQADGAPMSDAMVRALWLRRVQTRPADFLRARFAYQLSDQQASPP